MNGKENYQPQEKAADYEVGENQYIGKARGNSDLTVRVTYVDGVITAVEVVENNETPGVGSRAIDVIPGAIVAANSTDVDIVSGATLTSNGIIAAVNDALSQVQE